MFYLILGIRVWFEKTIFCLGIKKKKFYKQKRSFLLILRDISFNLLIFIVGSIRIYHVKICYIEEYLFSSLIHGLLGVVKFYYFQRYIQIYIFKQTYVYMYIYI